MFNPFIKLSKRVIHGPWLISTSKHQSAMAIIHIARMKVATTFA